MIYKWINFEGIFFFTTVLAQRCVNSSLRTSYFKSVNGMLFSILKLAKILTQFSIGIILFDRLYGLHKC